MKLPHAFARRLLASLTCAATIVGAPYIAGAQDKPAAKAEASAEKKGVKKEEDRRGPIPALYGKLVAPDQKEKIYAVQDKYQAELAPLTAKIKELQAARDKEIEAILTPEQLTKLKEMKAEQAKAAAAKRPMTKKAAGEEKPAGDKAATTEKPAETK